MAKPKLCEVIAVVSGKKGEVEKVVTDFHHCLQKGELFDGLSRTYRPKDADGESLPPEQKRPQLKALQLVSDAKEKWRELFDLTLTLDSGNCQAKGDLVVDDKILAKDIPVSTLLFLEKQLTHVKTFLTKLPSPNPAEQWRYNPDQDMLTTEEQRTTRTKKIAEPLVLYPATKEHPAQTQMIQKDVIAGEYATIQFTTRIPADKKNIALDRVDKLLVAVKTARERANSMEVDKRKMGEDLLSYVLEPVLAKEAVRSSTV